MVETESFFRRNSFFGLKIRAGRFRAADSVGNFTHDGRMIRMTAECSPPHDCCNRFNRDCREMKIARTADLAAQAPRDSAEMKRATGQFRRPEES